LKCFFLSQSPSNHQFPPTLSASPSQISLQLLLSHFSHDLSQPITAPLPRSSRFHDLTAFYAICSHFSKPPRDPFPQRAFCWR
jgi:hypothetical protein